MVDSVGDHCSGSVGVEVVVVLAEIERGDLREVGSSVHVGWPVGVIGRVCE